MKELIESTRDIARELARKYSTMTHDELDILESILVRKTYHKVKSSLPRAIYVVNFYIFTKECSDNSTSRRTNNSQNI